MVRARAKNCITMDNYQTNDHVFFWVSILIGLAFYLINDINQYYYAFVASDVARTFRVNSFCITYNVIEELMRIMSAKVENSKKATL